MASMADTRYRNIYLTSQPFPDKHIIELRYHSLLKWLRVGGGGGGGGAAAKISTHYLTFG